MILILSKDKDFSGVIAEQLERELNMPCSIFVSLKEIGAPAKQAGRIIVTNEIILEKLDLPVIAVLPENTPHPEGSGRQAPVKMQDILADIREILHKPAVGEAIVVGGGILLLPMQKQLKAAVSNQTVVLTDKEIQLLQALLAADEQGVTKEALLKEIWGFETEMDTHTLETHIYRLRAKFRELGNEQAISAASGGYILDIK